MYKVETATSSWPEAESKELFKLLTAAAAIAPNHQNRQLVYK